VDVAALDRPEVAGGILLVLHRLLVQLIPVLRSLVEYGPRRRVECDLLALLEVGRVGSPVVTVRGSLAGGLGEREPADDPDDPQEGSHRSGDPHAPASDRHREIKAGGEQPLEDDTCD
jgi:hypothetical protein